MTDTEEECRQGKKKIKNSGDATKTITLLINPLPFYLSSNLDTEELCGKFLAEQEHNLCQQQPCASEHTMCYDTFFCLTFVAQTENI